MNRNPKPRLPFPALLLGFLLLGAACGGGGGGGAGGDAPALGTWLPAFGALPALDGNVHTFLVVEQESGAVLWLGGSFQRVAGSLGYYGFDSEGLVGWDGERWIGTSLLGGELDGEASLNGSVDALALFDAGDGPAIYAGGDFEFEYGDVLEFFETEHLARFDGTRWSPVGAAPNGPVRALAVYDGGSGPRLFAGGFFTEIGGVSASRIAAFDGVNWSQPGEGATTGVTALAVHEDPEDGSGLALYMADGTRLKRWNGTTWTSLPVQFSATVRTLASHGRSVSAALHAGGDFTSLQLLDGGGSVIGTVQAHRVARWHSASGWSDMDGGADGPVFHLASLAWNGAQDLWAAGAFSNIGLDGGAHVARWDGEQWIGLGPGPDATVRTLALFDAKGTPEVHLGGTFDQVGSRVARRVARYDGEGFRPWTGGFDGEVRAFAADSAGWVVGGAFRTVGGEEVGGAASFDGVWSDLDGGPAQPGWVVNALVRFDDGSGERLFAGGSAELGALLAFDGATWSQVGPPFSAGAVEALLVHDDGSGLALFAGGTMQFVGSPFPLARWNGSAFLSLGSGVNGAVNALVVHPLAGSAALIAAGAFTTAGGAPAARVAAWDGGAWQPLAGGIGGEVFALATFAQGGTSFLAAAGEFSTAGGNAARRVARWDGSTWAPMGSGFDNTVRALVSFDDGSGLRLFAGGVFENVGLFTNPVANAAGIARWNGSEWDPLGPPPAAGYFEVERLYSASLGGLPRLVVAGPFANSPRGDAFLALWGPTPP